MGATSSQPEKAKATRSSKLTGKIQDPQDADVAETLVRMQHEDSQLRRNSHTAEIQRPAETAPSSNHSQVSVARKKKNKKNKENKKGSGRDRSSGTAIVASSENSEHTRAVTKRGEADSDSLRESASAKESVEPELDNLAVFLELRSLEYQPTPTRHPLDEVSDNEDFDGAQNALHTTGDYRDAGSPRQKFVGNGTRIDKGKGKLVGNPKTHSSANDDRNGIQQGQKAHTKTPKSSRNSNIFDRAKAAARIREEQLREECLKLATEGNGPKHKTDGSDLAVRHHRPARRDSAPGSSEAHISPKSLSQEASGDSNATEDEDEDLFVRRSHSMQSGLDETGDIYSVPQSEDEDNKAKRVQALHSTTRKRSKQVNSPTTTSRSKKRRLPLPVPDTNPSKKVKITGGRSRTSTASGRMRRVGVFEDFETQQLQNFKKTYCAEHGIPGPAFNAKVQANARNRPELAEFWNEVGDAIPDRDRQAVQKAARRMWHNFERGPWYTKEDEELAAYHDELGPQWRKIADRMDRMPGDVRDRYRNHVKGMENRKKDRWDDDEVYELKIAIGDCLAMHLATKDAEFKVGDLPETKSVAMEKLLNWAVVSDRMGETRSRLQCLYKWKKLKKRGLNLCVEVRKGWNRLLRAEGIETEENEGVEEVEAAQQPLKRKSAKGSKLATNKRKSTQKREKRSSEGVVDDATDEEDTSKHDAAKEGPFVDDATEEEDTSKHDAVKEGPFVDEPDAESDDEISEEAPTENDVDDVDEIGDAQDENEESGEEEDPWTAPKSDEDTSQDEDEDEEE